MCTIECSVHEIENAIRAGLYGEMDEVADIVVRTDGLDEFVRHILWMRCRESNAHRRVDAGDGAKQISKIVFRITIRIDVLAEKSHFLEPARSKHFHFIHYAGNGSASLAASCKSN